MGFIVIFAYDHTGERTLKMTGDAMSVDQNAFNHHIYSSLQNVTMYPSPYLVLSNHGYTKHYYAGADRVCARLGGGGLNQDTTGLTRNADVIQRVDNLFLHCMELVNSRDAVTTDGESLGAEASSGTNDAPSRIMVEATTNVGKLHSDLEAFFSEDSMQNRSTEYEPRVYFYHSDHLGSASWITDCNGAVAQYLQYLPFGQPFVDQHPAGYQERYTFTGKELDAETGYGYHGARYMDYELMTCWLSVDPMADKYTNISPYNYCMWNPIKLVDPNGMDTGYYNVQGGHLFTCNGGNDVSMMVVTDKIRMSYEKYQEGSYHSFDIKTIDIDKLDDMYNYSDKTGNECYYAVKCDGQHRNMQYGDNTSVHKAILYPNDQYNVHTHCRDIMNSDGSIKGVGGTNPSYNKDQVGIGDKFGIILGYMKVNMTVSFGTNLTSSSVKEDVKLVRAIGFYGKDGPLCNSVDYSKFRKTIIKLQK